MAVNKETVTWVKHWSDKTFSFKTTRNYPNKFNNGEFAMIGMEHEDKKLMRAYSFASANHEDYLEFLSIKIPATPVCKFSSWITLSVLILFFVNGFKANLP